MKDTTCKCPECGADVQIDASVVIFGNNDYHIDWVYAACPECGIEIDTDEIDKPTITVEF